MPGVRSGAGSRQNHVAFVLRGLLSEEECRQMIRDSEERGYTAATISTLGGQVHNTDVRNSGRNMHDSKEMAGELFARIEPHLPQKVNRCSLCGLNERLRFLRYDPGEHFAPHRDGSYVRPDRSESSLLTVMVYLNSGGGVDYQGGTTNFLPEEKDRRTEQPVVFTPSVGDVLVFSHRILHEGAAVTSGRKYAVRTDVMFTNGSQRR